ncbi:oxidized low-density lipoprotein receptor 1-like, partial [Polypterus senegalus]|uniref:oxidized low-density lipoprotein receptor 1-like n=1 Tax=Polypterus senegalus TaxID=55291 RepID=UPI001962F683
FIKLNNKEQDIEELRTAIYKLTNNNSALLAAHAVLQAQFERNISFLQESQDALQSQYKPLYKKHEELSTKFSNLKKYYCDVRITSPDNTCPVCKMGWILFRSKCYFFSTNKLTWNESRDWCLAIDGQLVNIESLEEWDFFNTLYKTIRAEYNPLWIGRDDIRASYHDKEKCPGILLGLSQVSLYDCTVPIHWICESAAFPVRI